MSNRLTSGKFRQVWGKIPKVYEMLLIKKNSFLKANLKVTHLSFTPKYFDFNIVKIIFDQSSIKLPDRLNSDK